MDIKRNYNNVKGIYLMISGILLYTLSDVFIKNMTSVFPVSEIAFIRALCRCIPLFIIILFKDKSLLFSKNYDQHMIRAFWGTAATLFFITSLKYGAMTNVYVIGYSGGLFTILFSSIFLKEKIGFDRAISVFLCMFGIYLALKPNLESMNNIYTLAPLLGVMCAAMNKISIKKLTFTDHVLTIALYVNLFMLVVALVGYCDWQPVSMQFVPQFLIIGITSVLSQCIIATAIRYGEISAMAHCDYSSFAMVVLLDIFYWNNIPCLEVIVGATLIIIGNIFVVYREKSVIRNNKFPSN